MARLLSSALIFVLAGCGPLTFSTELKGETVVLGNMLMPPISVFPSLAGLTDLDFNSNREFQAQRVTRDRVSAVAVESVTFKILAPLDQNFGFLTSVQLFARAGDKEILFAEKTDRKSVV